MKTKSVHINMATHCISTVRLVTQQFQKLFKEVGSIVYWVYFIFSTFFTCQLKNVSRKKGIVRHQLHFIYVLSNISFSPLSSTFLYAIILPTTVKMNPNMCLLMMRDFLKCIYIGFKLQCIQCFHVWRQHVTWIWIMKKLPKTTVSL